MIDSSCFVLLNNEPNVVVNMTFLFLCILLGLSVPRVPALVMTKRSKRCGRRHYVCILCECMLVKIFSAIVNTYENMLNEKCILTLKLNRLQVVIVEFFNKKNKLTGY